MPDLKPNELEALRRLKEALARRYSLVELRLFGSKARGDSGPESDIDVLIVLQALDWETRKAVSDLCCDISIDCGVVLAPSMCAQVEFESALTRITPFYESVQREGVSL